MDVTPDGHELWISDAMGGLTHMDLREPSHRASWFAMSDNKIGCVSINPVQPHFLVTASNSRSLKSVSRLANIIKD
jgi:WD repeat-containing protein 76